MKAVGDHPLVRRGWPGGQAHSDAIRTAPYVHANPSITDILQCNDNGRFVVTPDSAIGVAPWIVYPHIDHFHLLLRRRAEGEAEEVFELFF